MSNQDDEEEYWKKVMVNPFDVPTILGYKSDVCSLSWFSSSTHMESEVVDFEYYGERTDYFTIFNVNKIYMLLINNETSN